MKLADKIVGLALATALIVGPIALMGQAPVNPGVTVKGSPTPGNMAKFVSRFQIEDGGAIPTGDVSSVAITDPNGTMNVTGSPCASGACAFQLSLFGLITGASVGSATRAPVITFDDYGRATAISDTLITPAFSSLTGSLACSQTPALTGDVTTSAGSCATQIAAGVIVNADVNASAAIAFSKLAALSADQVLGALTATTPSGLSVPSCSTATSALTWTSGTGFGCNSIASGGDFVGPASSTDNAVVRFDGTTGKLGQNSVVLIGDTGNVTGVNDLTAAGAISGATATGAMVATKGQQETGTATNLVVTSGRQQYHDGSIKAWAVCTESSGTYTLAASYNISGGTCGKTGTGLLTLTFSTAFATANFGCNITGKGGTFATLGSGTAKTTTTVNVDLRGTGGSNADSSFDISCFGRQ